MQVHRNTLAGALLVMLTGFSSATLAERAQVATDLGAANAAQQINVTLVFKARHQRELEQFVYATVTPGHPAYHRFLSTAQFAERYGASDTEVARVRDFLRRQGISTGKLLPNHLALRASGPVGRFSAMLQAPVHDYVGPNGRRFRRPVRNPSMPAALAGTVVLTSGLSNQAHYVPHHLQRKVPLRMANNAVRGLSLARSTASGEPGLYTVGDVANFYNINPLYRAGVTGKGSTVGIITLADFKAQDARDYWKLIGLHVKPHRITKVHVDGGAEYGANAGSGETALDVEQAGGLAPHADIRVYDAPNSDAGFIDAFYTAVSENVADSISVSWGLPEVFYFDSPLTGGDYTGQLQAFHQVFLEAAAQGISMFAASGDSGAYDTASALGHTDFSAPLAVDAPASDPFITAAGGTTTPFSFSFAGGPTVSIEKEQVWGWDYLQAYLDDVAPGVYDLFANGGGGGVSVYWRTPLYQRFTHGIERTRRHQSLVIQDATWLGYPKGGPMTLLKLRGHFAGRNVPDISMNADPESGYLVVSSTDSRDGISTGMGGTSFVAPQLSGISALLRQDGGHRLGFWNPQMYALQKIFGYGCWAPFRDITSGDNWFYKGKPGYSPGAGIGTLDVGNLSLFLHAGF